MAEWVRVPAKGVAAEPNWVVRRADKKQEVLALIDTFNVTGRYLTKFEKSHGLHGPQIDLELNAEGGKLFSRLTGSNLPTNDGLARWLGIIVDGQLVSAAEISSQISDKGEITGNFTDAELDDLVARIGSGELPAKLRLVAPGAPAASK